MLRLLAMAILAHVLADVTAVMLTLITLATIEVMLNCHTITNLQREKHDDIIKGRILFCANTNEMTD